MTTDTANALLTEYRKQLALGVGDLLAPKLEPISEFDRKLEVMEFAMNAGAEIQGEPQ